MASAMKFPTYKELFWKQGKKTVSSAVIVGRFMLCREAFGDIENLRTLKENKIDRKKTVLREIVPRRNIGRFCTTRLKKGICSQKWPTEKSASQKITAEKRGTSAQNLHHHTVSEIPGMIFMRKVSKKNKEPKKIHIGRILNLPEIGSIEIHKDAVEKNQNVNSLKLSFMCGNKTIGQSAASFSIDKKSSQQKDSPEKIFPKINKMFRVENRQTQKKIPDVQFEEVNLKMEAEEDLIVERISRGE
ncbi:uncharacterized protein LOC117182855 [Belonocnema kinseyi]|uniref:uncharacterized protein LOC117182855 n=1 Tax=Belonocnema kinseyi TaxID=2817044 RepID=UPI00143D6470|nr:uncharacterized protein LOC117182855 [Belonocnema kinseyi]